ncbi:MAG: hypothetical protein ACK41C_19480 [Phenylobacterium sp.]|uniref:hypothetical protein n=1 Tax=Phenylobacterium sp. TaxID=1871053 RepID=UPI00391AA805
MLGDRYGVPGVQAERTLDEAAIAAYGLETINDLLDQVAAEGGEDEPPVILVNGELEDDVGDIRDYPAEAVQRLQVLPRGSAARVGGSATARVYNVVLKRSFHTRVGTVSGKVATEGGWSEQEGGVTYTRIQQPNRINATLTLRQSSSLLESERGLAQPSLASPFDLRGNVVADPRTFRSEIDPVLSALAGRMVTVAPVPSAPPSGLADFLGGAPNVTEVGRFRTLRPKSEGVEFNVSAHQRLTERVSAALTGRASYRQDAYLYGLPSAVLVVPETNPFSPFSADVGLAVYGRTPSSQRSRWSTATLNGTLSARLASEWQGTVAARYHRSDYRTRSMRQAFSGAGLRIVTDPAINPFAADLSPYTPLTREWTLSRSSTAEVEATLRGSPLELPAGPLRISAGGELAERRAEAEGSQGGGGRDRTRRERGGRLAVEIPITSRDRDVLPWLGDLSVSGEFAAIHHSDFGALERWSLGLNWSPTPRLRLHASRADEEEPARLDFLSSPAIATTGVRYLDVLTGETVEITTLTGANPALGAEQVTKDKLGVTLVAVKRLNLQLRAEYAATRREGAASNLPRSSLAVMAAFPDRFVRDGEGRLVLIDFRPIALDLQRHEQVSWGFSLDAPLGEAPPPPRPGARAVQRLRLQVSAAHTYHLTNEVVIRPGLPAIDLLDGESLGFGAALPRSQLSGSVGLSRDGVGLQVSGSWRSGSRLRTGSGGASELTFDPIGVINLRAWADLKTAFPSSPWARGARMTLSVANLFDERQGVADESGRTPLVYQPAYRDPIGRTVQLELRKTF